MPLKRKCSIVGERCTLAEAYLWVSKDIIPGDFSVGYDPRLKKELKDRLPLQRFSLLRPDSVDRIALIQLQEELTKGRLDARGFRRQKNAIRDELSGIETVSHEWSDEIAIDATEISSAYIKDLRTSHLVIGKGTMFSSFYYASDPCYEGVTIDTELLFTLFPSVTRWEFSLLSRGNDDEEQSQMLPYTTTLLKVLDAVREKIAADPDPMAWTRDAIEAECRGLLPIGSSGRDAHAIATVLLPDPKRRK
jgi:hypothetical protein